MLEIAINCAVPSAALFLLCWPIALAFGRLGRLPPVASMICAVITLVSIFAIWRSGGYTVLLMVPVSLVLATGIDLKIHQQRERSEAGQSHILVAFLIGLAMTVFYLVDTQGQICFGLHGDGAFYDGVSRAMMRLGCENILGYFSGACDGPTMTYHYFDLWLNGGLAEMEHAFPVLDRSKDFTLTYQSSTNVVALSIFLMGASGFAAQVLKSRSAYIVAPVILLTLAYPDYIDFHQKPKVLLMTGGLMCGLQLLRLGRQAVAFTLMAWAAVGFLVPVPFIAVGLGTYLYQKLNSSTRTQEDREGQEDHVGHAAGNSHLKATLILLMPAVALVTPFLLQSVGGSSLIHPKPSLVLPSDWLFNPYYRHILIAIWPMLLLLGLLRWGGLSKAGLKEHSLLVLSGMGGALVFISMFHGLRDIHQFYYNLTLLVVCVAAIGLLSIELEIGRRRLMLVTVLICAGIYGSYKTHGLSSVRGTCERQDFIQDFSTMVKKHRVTDFALSLVDVNFSLQSDQLFRHHDSQVIQAVLPDAVIMKPRTVMQQIPASDLRYQIGQLFWESQTRATNPAICSAEKILMISDVQDFDWSVLPYRSLDSIRSDTTGITYHISERLCQSQD